MKQLHPNAIWLFFFQFLFIGLVALIIISISALPALLGFSGAIAQEIILGLGLLVVIFYIFFCYIWAKLTYHFWRYEFAEDSVKIEQGVIWKKYISIPYERIQNVDIYRGILARIFGLSDLQIQTAGYSGGYGRYGIMHSEGRIPGIGVQTAEQLREELIKKVKGTKQGL